jgi:ATP-dependent DNA ligase
MWAAACQFTSLPKIPAKRTDRRYLPGDRSVWVKTKCLNRAELVIVGWSSPEGSRHAIGALILGYYDANKRLL